MPQYRISGDAPDLREIIPEVERDKRSLSFYSSPEALALHIGTINKDSCWYQGAWKHDSQVSFYGTASMSDAIIMCRKGWPEGAERVARLRDKINAQNPVGPRLVKYDVAGAYPIVPRAIAGNPMSMRRYDTARLRRKPVMTLLSDMSANANVKQGCITNRAAVVAAIVDVIEAAGYACHVVGFCSTSNPLISCIVAATIKESHQPVDIARLAFGLGHAAMFRRLCWVPLMEDRFTECLGSGLGRSTDIPTNGLAERGIYVLDSPNNKSNLYQSEDAAATAGLEHLIQHLAAQGCPAFEHLSKSPDSTQAA